MQGENKIKEELKRQYMTIEMAFNSLNNQVVWKTIRRKRNACNVSVNLELQVIYSLFNYRMKTSSCQHNTANKSIMASYHRGKFLRNINMKIFI